MPTPLRILAAISAHGFGHAMQTCLVLNALHKKHPDLQLVLRSDVNPDFLYSRLIPKFELLPGVAGDFGMQMHSAVDVDILASASQYAVFQRHWNQHLAQETAFLKTCRADLILADIPFLALAAAQAAGMPNAALCSLNWADIYWHYCEAQPGSSQTHACLLAAYQNAGIFIQPVPHMPMPDLHNTCPVGPLAQRGKAQKEILRQRLKLDDGTKLVMIGLGGIQMPLDFSKWPRYPDIHWLVPESLNAQREDMSSFSATGLCFIDMFSSCDAVLTKPGYGSFTEAACNGVPVLYLERPDWPETIHLEQWLHQYIPCAEISRHDLDTGNVYEPLEALFNAPLASAPIPDGAEQAARLLLELCGRDA